MSTMHHFEDPRVPQTVAQEGSDHERIFCYQKIAHDLTPLERPDAAPWIRGDAW